MSVKTPSREKPATAPKVILGHRRYVVRCTFVGEDKKKRLEGSFRIVAEAPDTDALLVKVEKSVKKLRRTGELPPRCDVYVEFVLELADLKDGIVVDFERWEANPRKFQHGCIAFSEVCAVHQSGHPEPAYRFGKIPEPPAHASVPAHVAEKPKAS